MRKRKRSGADAKSAKSAHLLDTSTLLWALGEPERLSAKARRLVEAGENVVSVASYWEVVIKTQKGLLSINDLATWWRRATELTSARILHIRPSHVTALAALPMLHKDPFDRILIAQARMENLAIVTGDEPIGEYPIQTIW
jgi:PIN domain nuclease of toxin-antitoxin system